MADTKIFETKNINTLRYAKEIKPENALSQDLAIMQETSNYQIRFQFYQGGGHPKLSVRRFFIDKKTGKYVPKRGEGFTISVHMVDDFLQKTIEAMKKCKEIPWERLTP